MSIKTDECSHGIPLFDEEPRERCSPTSTNGETVKRNSDLPFEVYERTPVARTDPRRDLKRIDQSIRQNDEQRAGLVAIAERKCWECGAPRPMPDIICKRCASLT